MIKAIYYRLITALKYIFPTKYLYLYKHCLLSFVKICQTMFKLHYCIENFSVPKLDPCDKIALEPNDTVDQQVASNVLKPSSAILLNIFTVSSIEKAKIKKNRTVDIFLNILMLTSLTLSTATICFVQLIKMFI